MIDSPAPMPMHGDRELPRITLRQEDLPGLIGWEVGSQHYIILRVEMVGKRNRKDIQDPSDQQKVEGDFQVTSVRSLKTEPVDAESLAREDFEKATAEAKSGKA